MRHLLFIACLVAALFSNCKKEQIIIKTPVPIDSIAPVDTVKHIIQLGNGSVLKNGIDWPGEFVAYYYGINSKKSFQIRVKESNINNGLSENFTIQDIKLIPGMYQIQGWRVLNFGNGIPEAAFGMSSYDEGIGNFYPDTTRADNFIEVLHCDTITNEVEGRFQVFMGKYGGPSTLPGVPDSVFLTEGKFYLKIK